MAVITRMDDAADTGARGAALWCRAGRRGPPLLNEAACHRLRGGTPRPTTHCRRERLCNVALWSAAGLTRHLAEPRGPWSFARHVAERRMPRSSRSHRPRDET